MIPLRDENPTAGTSIATLAILAVNALAWASVQGLGTEPALSTSVCEWGAIAGDLFGSVPSGTLVPLGPNLACEIGGAPNWLTPVTSMFLHGGWFHLLGNLWFLWVFGDNVEDSMGAGRFVVFYLLCGLAATATQLATNPASPIPLVGASGAIGGVMGAYAVLYPRAPVHMLVFLIFIVTRIVVPAWLMLGYWFLYQLLSGMPTLGGEGSGVAFWAHIGGFVAGVGLVFVFRVPERVAAHRAHRQELWSRAY
jgi:membrane associated rhomboid family serine protease